MERIRQGLTLLKKDIWNLRYAFLGIGIYSIVMHFLFGTFCPMLAVLRIPCPGCGMTRAFVMALTGRFALAWKLQPLVYGWILLGLWFGAERYLLFRKSKSIRMYLTLLLLATMFLYVYRMLRGFPVEILINGR